MDFYYWFSQLSRSLCSVWRTQADPVPRAGMHLQDLLPREAVACQSQQGGCVLGQFCIDLYNI